MPIIDKENWQKAQDNNTDPYGNACIKVARRAMEILDQEADLPIDAHALICRADEESNAGGITGFMAGAAANIISGVHSRGEEFRKAWNKSYGVPDEDDRGGVVNPAVITIGE